MSENVYKFDGVLKDKQEFSYGSADGKGVRITVIEGKIVQDNVACFHENAVAVRGLKLGTRIGLRGRNGSRFWEKGNRNFHQVELAKEGGIIVLDTGTQQKAANEDICDVPF